MSSTKTEILSYLYSVDTHRVEEWNWLGYKRRYSYAVLALLPNSTANKRLQKHLLPNEWWEENICGQEEGQQCREETTSRRKKKTFYFWRLATRPPSRQHEKQHALSRARKHISHLSHNYWKKKATVIVHRIYRKARHLKGKTKDEYITKNH